MIFYRSGFFLGFDFCGAIFIGASVTKTLVGFAVLVICSIYGLSPSTNIHTADVVSRMAT